MKPQPPVTSMRIDARNSSGAAVARVDSPELGAEVPGWLPWVRGVDWIPWGIIALGAFLRLLLLAMKPPHFDEGINGWFVDQMTKNGFYKYDPTNYHGPLHFYILFLSESLFGRNCWALRLPVALGSIYCLRLTFKFEQFLGRDVVRWAALAMAVSPGFVFYGRYAIHEVWLLLFSMLFVLGLLGLWRRGTADYLWCTGMGIAGMILTKETYIIHVGCAALAGIATWVSYRFTKTNDAQPERQSWTYLDLTMVTLVGLAAIVFFYSGNFLNWAGLKGLYLTFSAWAKTGQNGNGHEKPWFYWLKLIARYELPIAIGLLTCAATQLFRNLSLRFLAIYGVGVLAAYSIVRYKTPWCVISLVWPFLFLFGAAFTLVPDPKRRPKTIVFTLALAVSLVFSISLNFFRCSTFTDYTWEKERSVAQNLYLFYAENEPYVYVQTYNDIYKLTRPVLQLVKRNPALYQMTAHLIRTSAYPLPWIFGDFNRFGYYEHANLPEKLDADFLLVQEDRVADVEPKLRGVYYTEPLTIRPYQDTSKLYLSAKLFGSFYRGRAPDFTGKPPVLAKQPQR